MSEALETLKFLENEKKMYGLTLNILFFDYDEKIESQRLLRRLYDSINIKLEFLKCDGV